MERKFSKNTWYDWLINYIPELLRRSVGGFKDVIESLFKTNKPKQTVYGGQKKLSKSKQKTLENLLYGKKTKRIKNRIIRDILKLFEGEAEKQERQESEKKKTQNEILVKDKIIKVSVHFLNKKEEKIIINLKE